MTKKNVKNVLLYILLIIFLWVFCFLTLNLWLMPYSIEYTKTGEITIGYFFYSVIGLLFSTPAPFLSVLIIAVFIEKVELKTFLKGIFHTEKKLETTIITSIFCLLALCFSLINGTPNGSPWYMLPLGFILMIPFVGISEETGWRGFLEPVLEEKIGFPFSTLTTASIWYVWHFDLWLDPTSNHYGDSLIGFGITIFIWSFALAAIYKATKSVIACAAYHAFIDSIGAYYDWNLLFDSFPGNYITNIYRLVWFSFSIIVWVFFDKKEKFDLKNIKENK